MTEIERAAAIKATRMKLLEVRAAIADLRKWKRIWLAQLRRLTVTKRCRRCGEEMEVEQFYRENRYADGRRPYCIECDLARMKEYQRNRKAA